MANFFIAVKCDNCLLPLLVFLSSFIAGLNNFYQSFQFEQYVNTPTNNKRHTIDLVLSYGIGFSVSDHKTVIFRALLLQPAQKSACLIIFDPSSPSIFLSKSSYTVDKLLDHFDGKCPKILDDLAPVKKQNNQT